jgi:hypothetical protein
MDVPPNEGALFSQLAQGAIRWTTSPQVMLAEWEKTVEETEMGYPYGLDDFTNDLTVREQLQRVLDAAPDEALPRIRSILVGLDHRFRLATVELRHPIFAADIALAEPEKHFYYFRVPHTASDEIIEDLTRRKLITNEADLRG